MKISNLKKQFKYYRESLHTEIQHLHSMIAIIRQMDDASDSKFASKSPAFFNYSRFSLGVTTILWASKLFTNTSKKKEVNALKFIRFAQTNYDKLFDPPYYSKILDRSWPVTKEQTSEFNTEIENLVCFPELKKLRNKYYAHFDKKYLFKKTELFNLNTVTLSEIEKRTIKFHDILMKYSSAFDGSNYKLRVTNINDVQRLIDIEE